MNATTLEQLAQRIVDRLAEAGHIDPQRIATLTTQLNAGRLSEQDWRGEIERKLHADQDAARSISPRAPQS
jgi:hypothetical protein